MSAPGHGNGNKAVIAALVANVAIAVSKFVAFAVTGASSMLAEGVHSVADSGNQLLLLLGARRALRAPDEEHPFGYGRERYFWAFVVAVVLFTMGATFAIYEGIHKILKPEEITDPAWALGVLGFALVAESLSFRTALTETNKVRGDVSLGVFIRRAKVPELPVVLLEDFAAICGLLLALAAIVASIVTGNPVYDGFGTVAIGLLLGVVAAVLAMEMKSLLIGESASRDEREAIAAAIVAEPSVLRLIHMRTEHLGPEELLVAAKVEFGHELSLPEVAAAVDRVEARVRAKVSETVVMYVEPDVSRDEVEPPLVAEHQPGP
jgi:cation diffusion facilitator family transporter